MKELSIEDKAKRYDEAIEIAKEINNEQRAQPFNIMTKVFPELKESEGENEKWIPKEIVKYLKEKGDFRSCWIAWLEKQGGITKLSDEEQNKFAKGVLTSCALSFIDYLDAHKYEDKMCVSNGECEDIENAFHNAMWDRLHRYYCKYIEKQGEQKSADKAEPKFHEGEWLCENESNNYARFIQILEIVNVQGKDRYRISRDIHSDEDIVEFDFVEKYYHKFDIQDAKSGDVLYLQKDGREHIIIYKGVTKERFRTFVSAYCAYNGIVDAFCFADVSRYTDIAYRGIIPATKEQRDFLFQKMKEAGYEWDAEKKELKKIKQTHTETEKGAKGNDRENSNSEQNLADISDKLKEEYQKGWDAAMRQLPKEVDSQIWQMANNSAKTWEESFAILCATQKAYDKGKMDALKEQNSTWGKDDEKNLNAALSYIKDEALKAFVKNRTHPKPAWSEEDDYNLQCIIAKVTSDIQKGNIGRNNELIDWLKSLKDRVQPQTKYEWSEEDERIYKSIAYSFAHNYPLTVQQQEFVKFLKLKERYTWRPSDEQMTQLKKYCPDNRPLTSLYEQLKKLREE